MWKKCTFPHASFPLKWNWPGPFSFSRSPGVSFLKAGAGWAAGLVPDPHTLCSQEHGRSGRKDLSEPGESGGTALQAQMRWEGPFLTVICGCLLRGPYVPCLRLAKWNSWLGICIRWFFSQFLQLFDEGVREGGANHLFCGLRWHLIQLFLVFLSSAPPPPAPHLLPGPLTPQGQRDWKCIFSKCYFQKSQMKESWFEFRLLTLGKNKNWVVFWRVWKIKRFFFIRELWLPPGGWC